jgi:DNA invertase Pin-like site-specific DNA recombinase
MPLLDTRNNKDTLGTFISDLVLQILSYVAEQERTFIKQRQKEGIQSALLKGVKFGRPKIEKPQDFDIIVAKWKNKELKTKEVLEILKLKPNTFYNFANLENF